MSDSAYRNLNLPATPGESLHARLQVHLAERSYPILIGAGLCGDFDRYFRERFEGVRHVFLVYDQAVHFLAQRIREQLDGDPRRVSSMAIPSGEPSKNVEMLESIWRAMLSEKTDRGSVLIAIGGGVIGDLAGFAAATFARGIPYVQVPTTLLSQVDSSVGGKTGINLPGAKNSVGAFWQPCLVIIDTNTLSTLPQREFVSGLAEVAKYGVILRPQLFEYVEQNAERILERRPEFLRPIIEQSCAAKAQVVQEDELETSGRRAILNYGHTFAHAIEATTGYGQWLHGEAVAMGMNMAAHLALLLGRVSPRWVQRQSDLLRRLALPVHLPDADPETLWEAMQRDKKVIQSVLRFVLPCEELGKVELVPQVDRGTVLAAIELATRGC